MGEKVPNLSPEMSYREKVVASLPEERRKEIESIGSLLTAELATYLHRPESSSDIVDQIHNVIAKLSHALMYGDSSQPLNEARRKDIVAGLAGISEVLDISRDVRPADVESNSSKAQVLEHFLKLVDGRVRKSIKR